ncbi:hypothetical protein [Myceligenerans crystallogenes]|uniref:DUF2189 domain-containing protein n=1 Tax=Myceligenerans crystallogenes TaxID=316335 RepID=A0ABN2NHI6_9MICO
MSERIAPGPFEPSEPADVPAAAGTFTVGEALSFAWQKYTGNALLWILFVLLLVVANLVFNSGSLSTDNVAEVQQSMRSPGEAGFPALVRAVLTFAGTGLGLVLGLIGVVASGILQGMGTAAALDEAGGAKPTFAGLFRPRNLGMIVVAALLLVVAQAVGAALCGIGLLVVAVFAVFTYQGVIDKDQNAWAAFTASFRLVGRNLGPVLLLELALLGINVLGALLCGLGLLITIPVTLIALAFAYRRLAGGPVVA